MHCFLALAISSFECKVVQGSKGWLREKSMCVYKDNSESRLPDHSLSSSSLSPPELNSPGWPSTCKDAIEDHVTSKFVRERKSTKNGLSVRTGSNPLALVNRISGNPTGNSSTRRAAGFSRREVFPVWVSARDRKLLQSSAIKKADVVGCQGWELGTLEQCLRRFAAAKWRPFRDICEVCNHRGCFIARDIGFQKHGSLKAIKQCANRLFG
ncbi:hypothetical protein Salat_1038400 [Sesamum alatum]|uniref:Uncharacterized protein n=1 Tax=Sesamum alatum TaxID=300844 RepID=A0AAE1YMJ6_9LAMI|nr:hypothetical protein Salat_1038400 [Sesamum alatum]